MERVKTNRRPTVTPTRPHPRTPTLLYSHTFILSFSLSPGLLASLSVVFCVCGALLLGAVVIAWFSMHPIRSRRFRQTPASFSAPFEDIEFPSHDGTPLSGWLIPAENARAVILLCHGMSADRTQMLPWADWLRQEGYTLLLFDFRALGRSGGDLCTMGLYEPGDIQGALDYLDARADTGKLPVAIMGFSMGGVAAIIAAADDTRIRAVVSHGAYSDLNRAISQRCRKHFGHAGPVVEAVSRRIGQRWFPASSEEVSPIKAIGRIAPRPVLLLNGLHDRIVLPVNAEDMHAAAGGAAEVWILPNSPHAYPTGADLDLYKERVIAFFNRSLAENRLSPDKEDSFA